MDGAEISYEGFVDSSDYSRADGVFVNAVLELDEHRPVGFHLSSNRGITAPKKDAIDIRGSLRYKDDTGMDLVVYDAEMTLGPFTEHSITFPLTGH